MIEVYVRGEHVYAEFFEDLRHRSGAAITKTTDHNRTFPEMVLGRRWLARGSQEQPHPVFSRSSASRQECEQQQKEAAGLQYESAGERPPYLVVLN